MKKTSQQSTAYLLLIWNGKRIHLKKRAWKNKVMQAEKGKIRKTIKEITATFKSYDD